MDVSHSVLGGVAAVVCLLACQIAPGAEESAEEEGRAEFQLFRNAMEDIVTRCIYRVDHREVIAGALKAVQRDGKVDGKSADDAWLIFKDTLRELAAAPESKQSLKDLVERSLKSYCRTLDRYSYYDDHQTWQQSERLRQPDFLGIGATLLEGREDDIVCAPYPGGPAERAGLDDGDRLVAVGERAVRGASLLQIKNWLAETQDKPVDLRVRHREGVEETITIPKERVASRPVSVEQSGGETKFIVRSISDRSLADLRDTLRSTGPGKAITLDLRGCPGGPLQFAVSIASLFLPANSVVGKLETTEGTETLLSNNPAPYKPSKVTLLQDRFTASAAELIITALRNHRPLRAESYGEKSYGKGVTQRRIKVSDKDGDGNPVIEAGVLTITDSRIYGPNGEFWDETGLAPSR